MLARVASQASTSAISAASSFLIAGPDRRGELAELLGQPEERGRVAAGRVLGTVHL